MEQQEDKLKPRPEIDPQSLVKPASVTKSSGDNNAITVSGVGNLLTHMAKCCHPVPGDQISGFITQGRGISVHRFDCEQLSNALSQQPERIVEVQWGNKGKQSYQASIQLIASDHQGLVRDVSTIIANERVSIVGLESHLDSVKETVAMVIKIEIANNDLLSRLISKLLLLDAIVSVKRL